MVQIMKRTPLYATHLALGARMIAFAGWEMPLQYPSGVNQEHLAVREACGLFDVSHMGEIRVRGAQATAFLSYVTLNDPAKLKVGAGQYSMLPNDRGGLVDDIYLYRHGEADYLMVCNAANTAPVWQHLQALAASYDVELSDESADWALLAVQGPTSLLLLSRLVPDDLTAVKKNRTLTTRLSGHPVTLARTGYTGEDGFELFARPDDSVAIFQALVDAGAVPCGLGARDTLRLEAGFPLYGHEFTADTNPLCSDYAWVVKDKPFYGRQAMWGAPCSHRLIGLKLLQRGIARQGYAVLKEDRQVGWVTSGTISPLTRESIAMAWVETALSEPDTLLMVEVRGQQLPAMVVRLPFYRPPVS
jgi:aminomethyltransferase